MKIQAPFLAIINSKDIKNGNAHSRVSPSGRHWGGDPPPPLPKKSARPPHVPPTVLTQKC